METRIIVYYISECCLFVGSMSYEQPRTEDGSEAIFSIAVVSEFMADRAAQSVPSLK